jgi:HK97 family phage portal protein
MNAFERIKAYIKKTWSSAPSLASSELLKLYHTNPRLDGARIIATKCASTELYLYNRPDYRINKDKAEVIETHELYDLLDDPCPSFRELTGWHIKYFVYACYVLVGEAYLLKIRMPNGKVISLSPIAPSWVVKTPTAESNYYEIYPYGTCGGNSIVVPSEDVICFKDIDLNDPFGRGKGTAETIGDEIQSDEYASKYAKNLFFNDATPSAIIYAPNGNKETADQIKQTWMQKMAGFRHAKEPMVLTGEGAKFEKVSQTPTELDFVESRRFLRDSALQQFHIPPEITGILESSNRSTIDSAFYLLNKNVLADYLRMFERVMNTQLLWEDFDRDKKLIFHHENTIEEDIEQQLRFATEGLRSGAVTVNDWRRDMGLEIDEKGGDVYLRSFGMLEVPYNEDRTEVTLPDIEEEESVTITDDTPTETPAETPAENQTEPEKELSIEEFEKLCKDYGKKYKILKSEGDKARRGAIWKLFDARARSVEEPFIKAMNKAFDKQNELVNATIKKAVEDNKDVGTAVERLFDNSMDESLKHTLAGAFIRGLETGAVHAEELLGDTGKRYVGEVKISDEVRRLFNLWVDNYGLELCKDINDTTKKKLRKVLSESMIEGDTLAEQVKKLIEASDGMFAEDKKWRAMLIARTESCSTVNAGANELYKAEGVQMKEWIATLDDRTRDAHLAMDGVVIPINDKFEVPATSQSEGAWMDYAGDPTAPVGQVANCRCTISPFVTL